MISYKKIILIITLVLITLFGYWYLFVSKKEVVNKSGTNSLNQNLKTQVNVSNTLYDKEFVSSLIGLNSVNLDVSIFELETYKALSYPEIPFVINYSKESGRNNPFLPIGVDSEILNKNIPTQNTVNNSVSSTTVSVSPIASSTSSVATPVPTTLPTTPSKPLPKSPTLKRF